MLNTKLFKIMSITIFMLSKVSPCIHGTLFNEKIGAPKIMINPNPKNLLNNDASTNNSLTNTEFHPIKIKINYSNLNKAVDVTKKQKRFIKKTIMPRVLKRISDIIKVKGNSIIQKFDSCGAEIKVPRKYKRGETLDTDLLIFVKMENSEENFTAYAGACLLESIQRRPVVGRIVINSRFLSITPEHIDRLYDTLVHEVVHILGFSRGLYQYFDTDLEQDQIFKIENGIYKLKTPKVVQAAKEHFNCETLSEVVLENEGNSGSSGSHLEKIHYGNGLMTAQRVAMRQLSKITLALLEDSGWYKADYDLADDLVWGRDKGCAFVQDTTCSTEFNEYCTVERALGCSSDYKVKTYCQSNTFSNECFINDFFHDFVCGNTLGDFLPTSNYTNGGAASLEVPGKFSRCFLTKLGPYDRAGCFVSKCVDGNIVVSAGGNDYTCGNDGDQIVIGDFNLICPDSEDFCGLLEATCEEDCNGNGKCMEGGECFCDNFHFGPTCAEDMICKGKVFCKLPTTDAA